MPDPAGVTAGRRRWPALAIVALALVAALLSACAEPTVDLDIPDRGAGQQALDHAGLLAGSDVDAQLAQVRERDGVDVVAVAFESTDASLGHAHRSAEAVVGEWDADVVLVAVAEPGDFTSTDPQRRRFFGLAARDVFAVSRSARERITEELAPPLAGENDWAGVFAVAIEEVVADVAPQPGGR